MPRTTVHRYLLASALLLLQACAQPEARESQPAAEPGQAPEISLNLPSSAQCACAAETASRDYTFLDKGLAALAAGDYVEAVQYFQRYRRLEPTTEAKWEASVAIAYVSSLSSSPFYDAAEARDSFAGLERQDWRHMQVHPQVLVLRQSLENFVVLERHVRDVEASNATLREDLDKREEAIKRLRELTLGQKGAPP